MKYTNKFVNPVIVYFRFALCLAIFFLYACNGSSGSDESNSEKGALSFALKFNDQTSASVSRAVNSPSGDVCLDYGIELIGADVFDAVNSAIASDSWPCSDHQGTFDDIPAGEGYSLIVEGVVESGDVDWRGEIAGITVTAGEITNVGLVILFYVGDDEAPPEVVSTDPVDAEICVAPDGIITAVFSEAMISATVNESTFTLTNGTTPVRGTVTYDPATLTATFTSDNTLAFTENYTVTISEDVEDMAGNKMAENVTWSFTTIYAGDYDSDCDVDGDDLSIFSAAYAAGSPEADLNDDGEVNSEDVQVFSMNFGYSGNDNI